jgi:Flp pilus assembly protein TadG
LVEFGLVGGVFFAIMFGAVDAGLLMYVHNAASHAAQVGMITLADEGTTSTADTDAITQLVAAGSGLTTIGHLDEIDIYQVYVCDWQSSTNPSQCTNQSTQPDGTIVAAASNSIYYNAYKPDGTCLSNCVGGAVQWASGSRSDQVSLQLSRSQSAVVQSDPNPVLPHRAEKPMSPLRSSRRERGQAMVETAAVFALIVLLLAGVYAVGTLASDQNTATTAVRAGGRFAAELGNGSSLASCGTCSGLPAELPVDSQIVGETCRIMATMPDLILPITSIVIYNPQTNADGSYSASDPSDNYNVSSTCAITTGSISNGGYPLASRNQTHPSESQVGIYVKYQFKSPTPFFQLNLQTSDYTVITVAPTNV